MDKGKIFGLVLVIAFGLFVLFFCFALIRTVISDDYNKDNYCILKYGENFRYFSDKDFGYYCRELDFEKMDYGKAFPISRDMYEKQTKMDEFCNVPEFFDVTKWSNDCSDKEAKKK